MIYTITADTRVAAVTIAGNGAVTSSPAGINCTRAASTTSGQCADTAAAGSALTLSASPGAGWQFSGWGGACSGVGSCDLALDVDRSVTATFSPREYTISVAANPVAGGTVTGAGTYAYGSTPTLHAIPDSGYTFQEWTVSGSTVWTTADYSFLVTGDRSLVAVFVPIPPSQRSLEVAISGDGSVVSSPAGISCDRSGNSGGTCTGAFTAGTTVTLTQHAANGWSFGQWGGACSGSGGCQVVLDQDRSATATFNVNQYTIAVSASPAAGGTATGGGTYPHGSSVELHASAAAGYRFDRWTEGGADVSTSTTYDFTATANRSLVAHFVVPSPGSYALAVTLSGAGSVTSSPAGINCEATTSGSSGVCAAEFAAGTSVSLSNTAANGWQFANWNGDCSGTGSCQVTMNQNRAVGAVFTPPSAPDRTLTVAVSGNGSVTSTPAGIACTAAGGMVSGTCMKAFHDGTVVQLTAQPAQGWSLSGWSGACGGTATCQTTLDQNRSVGASFTSPPTAQSHLTLTVQPAGGVSGAVLATQPNVQVENADGSAAAQAGMQVTARLGSGTGTVSGGVTAPPTRAAVPPLRAWSSPEPALSRSDSVQREWMKSNRARSQLRPHCPRSTT